MSGGKNKRKRARQANKRAEAEQARAERAQAERARRGGADDAGNAGGAGFPDPASVADPAPFVDPDPAAFADEVPPDASDADALSDVSALEGFTADGMPLVSGLDGMLDDGGAGADIADGADGADADADGGDSADGADADADIADGADAGADNADDADNTDDTNINPVVGADSISARSPVPDVPDNAPSPKPTPTPPRKKHPSKSPRPKRHPLRWTLLTLLARLLASLTAGFFIFDVSNWQRLDVTKILGAPRTGGVYDAGGALVSELRGKENRVVVPFSEIPRHVRDAFIAAEDLRFYQHPGFDTVRIFGAVVSNLRNRSYSQGASTITQQLVKLSHLTSEKTIARKLEEVWLAVQLEHQYSKDDILWMYLNYIYFGSGAYGVQTAAQTYFGVDAAELSVAQAASLAASIKATAVYAPTASPSANRSQRVYILDTMLENGMIDEATHEAAVAEEITPLPARAEDTTYGWFVDAVLDEAEKQLGVSGEALLGGGYRIHTTLDRTLQDTMNKQYQADVFPAKASDGTRVESGGACVDIATGAVRAIVGGRSYTVRRGLNRATMLRRQPGSALKPLAVYAPAIESHGYTAASVLKDEPTNFNGYTPRNSGNTYYGNVTVRTALTYSLNVAAVSLLNQIGVQSARDYLTKVGIPLDDRDANLSIALGALTYGCSPVQLAAAYAPFGNGGYFNAPYFIERVEDATGRTVYAHDAAPRRVISAQTAYVMTSLLQSVTSSGTGAKLSGAGTPVAGKTGTVNMTGGGNRDIWMATYNPEITTAFWMGFDDPDSKHKLASWVSGGDNTAALARNFFKAVYSGRSKPKFARPKGIVDAVIDKKAVQWRGEVMLAGDLTPDAYRVGEVFVSGTQPKRASDVWSPPRTPSSFKVTHTERGNPLLVIQTADSAVYRIQRDAVGESFVMTELRAAAGETLYYADTRAQPGIVYTYRVIPVHAELLDNGILLEGVQSVQVAQASAPRSGGFAGGLLDLLFGGGTAGGTGGTAGGTSGINGTNHDGFGTEEAALSIFWD